MFGFAAKHGLLVHVRSGDYEKLRNMAGKFKARDLIRRFIAHNGKMGYNWDKKESKYK
jgi:hypothetical protein